MYQIMEHIDIIIICHKFADFNRFVVCTNNFQQHGISWLDNVIFSIGNFDIHGIRIVELLEESFCLKRKSNEVHVLNVHSSRSLRPVDGFP